MKCPACNGIGGIPANVRSDDSDYHIAGGMGGIKCPKCGGSGKILRYEIGDDEILEATKSVRQNLFYEVLEQEMRERDWGFTDLDYETDGCGIKLFELAHKNRSLTDELARCLAKGFGTSTEFWKNLYEMTINKPDS